MKWGGAVVSVLLLVVWAWSVPMYMASDGSHWVDCYVRHGLVLVSLHRPATPDPETFAFALGGLNSMPMWLPDAGRSSTVWYLIAPIWFLIALSSFISAFAWRLDTLARRRARIGFCHKCNYSRTGLAPSAVCPECGTARVSA